MTGTGDLNPAASFFAGPGAALVYCGSAAVAAAARKFKDRAVVIDAGADLSLSTVLQDLHLERSVATVLIEGGARILRTPWRAAWRTSPAGDRPVLRGRPVRPSWPSPPLTPTPRPTR